MTCTIALMGMLWLIAIVATIAGTILALRKMKANPPHLDAPFGLYPVSILKPLKGADSGLRENLKSFFELEYPQFEILFSVADFNDPARALVESMMHDYPWVDAKLVVGDVNAGPNPKVNNLIRTHDMAKYDLILISDSNVRVPVDYVRRVTAHLENGVGVITAVVAGCDATSVGGLLEATYLNTFYARWMHLTAALGQPCVVGKSMLFSRGSAARFGGIRALAQYLAEDYMMGIKMRELGLKVIVQADPVRQHIGRYATREFWARHIRWGRIRKAQAPAAFFFEPLLGPLVSGALGASAAYHACGLAPSQFLAMHFGVWSFCDLWLARRLEGVWRISLPLTWALRELLAPPLWAHTALGNSVLWRGRKLVLGRGGVIATTSRQTAPQGFSIASVAQPKN